MTELDTKITAVVVYVDRARIARVGALALEPGSHRIEIPALPVALDIASVRAAARGTARARLLGVDVRRAFYTDTPQERVHELERQIESLEDEQRVLDGRVVLLEGERDALRALAAATQEYARGLALGRTTPADQLELFDRVRERAETLDADIHELTVQRRGMERQLEKLRNELNQLRGAQGRERYVAVVEVDVVEAGELTFELTYVVSNAGWIPLYDLRLLEDGAEPALEVGYLAQVSQRTGEEWQDVALTLSTARPALAGTLPELRPWMIGPVEVHKPRPARRMMAMEMGSAVELSDAMAVGEPAAPPPAPQMREAETVTATVETSGAAVTYRVPAAASVPADGAPAKVTVARYRLAPELNYVAAPKLVEAVYRRARVENDSPYTLLPGPVNLFAGDEFVGATRLDLTAPGGEIELYLGVDDRIKIERDLKRRDVDRRLIGDRRRLTFGYEIRLENALDGEARLTLHDQIPAPLHEEIKIKLESADPRPDRQDELGLLRWELTLAPREKRTLRFDFAVEHPREMQVMGLP